MMFSGESRWRKVALYAGLGLLILLVLSALQAFNTTLPVRIWHYTFNLNFFNPETASETLIFTGLTGLVFLLLLLLLMLLLRNILKIYTGQGSSGLGARLRSRMVLGAVLIALMPAVFMFLFSYTLMNRSLDRWFSPNTTPMGEARRSQLSPPVLRSAAWPRFRRCRSRIGLRWTVGLLSFTARICG